MALVQRPLPTPPSDPCSCSAPSPTYHPKMESLSDLDLKVLEIFIWLNIAGPADLSCSAIQTMADPSSCFTCLTPRKRQELIVSAFGDPGVSNQAMVRQALEAMERCLTPDQIDALLAYAKYEYILNNLRSQ